MGAIMVVMTLWCPRPAYDHLAILGEADHDLGHSRDESPGSGHDLGHGREGLLILCSFLGSAFPTFQDELCCRYFKISCKVNLKHVFHLGYTSINR